MRYRSLHTLFGCAIVALGILFTGCTIRPVFAPTTESTKDFKVMYQESEPASAPAAAEIPESSESVPADSTN